MELVELTPLQMALVGLQGRSGLSVEQRKRLTIAVELVANPSIIFMWVSPCVVPQCLIPQCLVPNGPQCLVPNVWSAMPGPQCPGPQNRCWECYSRTSSRVMG